MEVLLPALQQALALVHGASEQPSDADSGPQNAREFQSYRSQRHYLTMEERTAKVAAWASHVKSFTAEVAPGRLRRLILRLTAGLSAPRFAGTRGSAAGPQDGIDVDRKRKG